MKRFILVLLVLSVTALMLIPASSISAEGKGNQAKGRYYFRQSCKECHTKGGKGGEITPLSKTQAQWLKYFAAGKHNKEGLEKVMSADQLRDVAAYLHAHAADSPQPETCGK